MGSIEGELIKRVAEGSIRSSHAVALTGAGISTESGIPDFRGPSGIWTRAPEAERRAYRSYERFLENPKEWWEERLSSPGLLGDLEKVMPNPGHYALAELERMGILKTIITQNVDGLHQKAGSKNVLEYHGNAFKLRCTTCGSRFSREEFDMERLRRENLLPPHCGKCRGVIKTDGVAFGEPIPSDVAHQSLAEAWKCDLMLICGTSAVVYPFANLPRTARAKTTERERKTETGLHVVEKIPAVTIIEVNNPPASWGASVARTLAPSPLEFALQRLKTLLATPPCDSSPQQAAGYSRWIFINAEPTPLTYEGVSDYLLQGKTGEILPQIVAEVKKLRKR